MTKTRGLDTEAHIKAKQDSPVSYVRWVSRSNLTANNYNPNAVAPPELELLILSILEDGWTQPIVCAPDFEIIDGFHRYTVSADPRLYKLYGGQVPVVVLDKPRKHRMMSTIRHNRARGTHGVVPMAKIVQQLQKDGVSNKEMERRLGMEDEEVARLADRAGMPEQVQRTKKEFGKSWVPVE